MSYKDSFENNHTDFRIDSIKYEPDARSAATPITFEYTRPSISVDVAGRFATHKIVGGSTVRQKIGEDPIEVSISGVCTEETAFDIDGLRDAKSGKIYSQRFSDSLTVQFASASTSPLEDGGSAALTGDGQFLYTFDLECVEITA